MTVEWESTIANNEETEKIVKNIRELQNDKGGRRDKPGHRTHDHSKSGLLKRYKNWRKGHKR